YKYEPWHIRFVGKELASKVSKKGITLEEYYNDYMQVDNPVQ
ncbi:D-alanyl-D-alanine carboxypeptidase family protein, partial [Priestia megaterium]